MIAFPLLPDLSVQLDREQLERLGFHAIDDERSHFEQIYIQNVSDAFLGHRIIKKEGVYYLSLRFDGRLNYTVGFFLSISTFLIASIASLISFYNKVILDEILLVPLSLLFFLLVRWIYPVRRNQIKRFLQESI